MSATHLEYDSKMVDPAGWQRVSRPRVETNPYSVPVEIPTPHSKPLPLFSFTAPQGDVHFLRTPLPLRVSIDGGEVYVENDALNIFGHGKTLHEAVVAFSHDLAYFWTYYRNLDPGAVAGEGTTLKRLYEDLVP